MNAPDNGYRMDRLLTARVRRLLVRAGWAPLAVVGFHAGAAALFGHVPRLDPAMHFLGGGAAAYFIAHALSEWEEFFGRPSPWGRRLVVFALATMVAVFWEFLEFSTGAALGLYSQLSLAETVGDLLFGCAGAAAFLGARTLRMKILKRVLQFLAAAFVLSGLGFAYYLFLWAFTPGSMIDEMFGSDRLYAWTAARYRAAGTADRLEITGLTGGDAFEQGQAVCRATLKGDDLAAIVTLWTSMDFDIKFNGMCHYPVYRLRFYSGLLKKLDATACWRCGNLNPASIFPPVPKMGFDSESPEARRLYKALQAHCPGTPALEEKPAPSSKP